MDYDDCDIIPLDNYSLKPQILSYPPWDFRSLISLDPIPIDFAIQSIARENLVEFLRSYKYITQTNQLNDELFYIMCQGLQEGISNYSYPLVNLQLLHTYPEFYTIVIEALTCLKQRLPVLNYGDTFHHYNEDCSVKTIDLLLEKFCNAHMILSYCGELPMDTRVSSQLWSDFTGTGSFPLLG